MRWPRPSPRAGAAAAAALACGGCGGLQVGRDAALWGLWLLPALGVFFLITSRWRRRALVQLLGPSLADAGVLAAQPGRQRVRAGLILLAVAGLVLALAELRYGFTWETVQRRGVDVVVALDLSDSMRAPDSESAASPSRLVRSKRKILDLVQLLRGDRIGLVGFAGSAFLFCPLTLDYAAAALFLEDCDPEHMPTQGTALAEAIRTSLEALGRSPTDARAILLISDGEDHAGEALVAAAAAKAQGVPIYTLSVGRPEGRPIPATGGGYRRDAQGKLILSRPDPTLLRQIAEISGGAYSPLQAGDADLAALYGRGIRASLQARDLTQNRRQRWHERFQWFVAVALLALAGETLLGAGWLKRWEAP